jgi:hypothetical protein
MIKVDRDRLEWVAGQVHEGHDPFAPQHCQREVCRELAAMLWTDPRIDSPTIARSLS